MKDTLEHIIFVIDYLTLNSGGPRFLINVFKKLIWKGYEVTIITGYADKRSKVECLRNRIGVINLEVYEPQTLPSRQPVNVIGFLRKASRLVRKLIKRTPHVIIHLNSHFPIMITYSIRLYAETPVICSLHHLEETSQFSSIISKAGKTLFQDILEVNTPCTIIHVPSNTTKEKLTTRSLINRRNIVVIPPGIEVERYLSIPRRPEEGIFIMIGRLEPRKHYDHAILAFKLVTKLRPNYKLYIIGQGYLQYHLQQLIKRFDLERNVYLLGAVDEKIKLDLISRAIALVHLGYPEGFGIAVLEALATGTPVIAYNVPPINEIVKNGVAGILVEKGNIVELAKAVMNMDRSIFDSRILRNLAKRFDIDIVAKQFDILYRKSISRSL